MEQTGQGTATFEPRSGNGEEDSVLAAQLTEAQQAVERLSVRINASHAHYRSLSCAAQGLQTVGRRLDMILREWAEQRGWTPECRMARTTLDAMHQQLQVVLAVSGPPPLDQYRESVKHVLFRALDTLVLLRESMGSPLDQNAADASWSR